MKQATGSHYTHQLKLIQHSIATPITSLLLNLESLRQFEQPVQKNFQFHLNQAWLSAHYLQELVKHLAKPDSKIEFNVNLAINEVTSLISSAQNSGQLIELVKTSKQLRLRGNKFCFQECLICLLNNAFEAYQAKAQTKLVVLMAEEQDEWLLIKVVDGGNGFQNQAGQLLLLQDLAQAKLNQQQLDQVATSKNHHLGFGLEYIQAIVCQKFKGRLEIESHQKKGSSINCYFPLSSQ